ncbi:MAG: PQQ-dependent sugar dehydrogenase [Armatimonadota bacterium]
MKKICILPAIILTILVSGCSSVAQDTSAAMRLLKLPSGFRTNLYASGLDAPRLMALSPDGRVFVTEMGGGRVTILPDVNGDGKADSRITYASGLNQPHGIIFHGSYLYIAETNRVIRYAYRKGDNKASKLEVIIRDLPSDGGHSTRTITFGDDGKLYVSIGSSCNVCVESNPLRAAIIRCNADGSGRQIFASGLRNSVGMAWNPVTKELWATDNGRDMLGDDIPPEEVNIIRQGGFYGWPYAYGDRVPDPEYGDSAPQKVRDSIPPYIKIQAHSAPLDLAFYTGTMFPQEYRGDLFIAYHGSWNRSIPTGYKVIRFQMEAGKVVGQQQDFITGFTQNGRAWARPVGFCVGKRGEMYITDDRGGRVFRVTYR